MFFFHPWSLQCSTLSGPGGEISSESYLDTKMAKNCVPCISLVGQRSTVNSWIANYFSSQRWEKTSVPANSSALPVLLQTKYNSTLNSLTNWLWPFSGAWWATEDNVLQAGKFIKDRIILNSNMWKKVTWFEIEMRWIRWAKSLIFTLADELKGIFDEKGYFSLTMVEMETCNYCVKSAIHPKKKEGHFLLRCDCAVLLLILESTARLDPVFFTGPQTESCKSIKSSERSTGFGCDNDLQKTTNGEWTCLTLTHTHACTWTHTDVPSTPLYYKLAEQSPHSSPPHTVPAADWGGSAHHNAMEEDGGGGGQLLEGIASPAGSLGYPAWAPGLSG